MMPNSPQAKPSIIEELEKLIEDSNVDTSSRTESAKNALDFVNKFIIGSKDNE